MKWLKKKEQEEHIERIPIDRIRANPYQPRQYFDKPGLEALAQSIVKYGILQPLSVRQQGEWYELIAGERRLRAASLAGLKTVPCLVYQVTGEAGAELAIVENLLREDLSIFETARAMDRLGQEFGLTQEQIASRLSVSQSYVANKLRLLRIPETLQEKILAADLTERHARALLRLPEGMWADCLEKMIARHLNVAAAEALVENMLAKCNEQQKKRGRPAFRGAMRDLRLFYNSVDRAVEMVRRCGVQIESKKEEREEEICLIISIPKKKIG